MPSNEEPKFGFLVCEGDGKSPVQVFNQQTGEYEVKVVKTKAEIPIGYKGIQNLLPVPRDIGNRKVYRGGDD